MKLYCKLIKLFETLLARALINYYNSLKLIVKIHKSYITSFKTTAGLKQRGSASPKLFALYMEPLTKKLNEEQVGKVINLKKVNDIMYADDVILLANTAEELGKMLKTAHKLGIDNELTFNPSSLNFILKNLINFLID